MSLFKRLFSTLTDSSNPVSEPAKPIAPTETKVEVNEPTATESTSVITQYQGEIHSGTRLMVSDGQFLIALKDGNIVDVLAPGVYMINEQNISNFASSSLYYISTLESETIKWGTIKPINFTDSNYGNLSLRAMGTFSYIICDPVKFIMDYLNAGEGISADEYIKNLVINAVQQLVYQNNGTSYTRLPMAVTNTAIKDQLETTGIKFTVRIQMINLTEESQSKIKTAMNNLI